MNKIILSQHADVDDQTPQLVRCAWTNIQKDELLRSYHDKEWGVPLYDDYALFEFLVLEGAQAGLSWTTILHRRDGYRSAFAHFDPQHVAAFTDEQIVTLLTDAGIIRNKAKINSAIRNAQCFLEVQREFGTFSAYQWQFVNNHPIQHGFRKSEEIPAVTPEAEAFSKDLKRRGFTFVGPTIMYAHMQATGMVNDHTTDCFRYQEIKSASARR